MSLLFLYFSLVISTKAASLFYNSSGFFQDDNDAFLSIFNNSSNFQLSDNQITITQKILIPIDFAIICNPLCVLKFQEKGGFRIKSNSTFSLNNIEINIETNLQTEVIIVEIIAKLHIFNSVIRNINTLASQFCTGQEQSSFNISNFLVSNITMIAVDKFVLFNSSKNVNYFFNISFQSNSLSNLIFLQADSTSKIQIIKLNFEGNWFTNTKGINLINLGSAAFFMLSNSTFLKNNFRSTFIYCFGNSISESNFSIINTLFSENYVNSNFVLLKSDSDYKYMKIEGFLISFNVFGSSFMEFSAITHFEMFFSEFINNVSPKLISLSNIDNLNIQNVVIRNNNDLGSQLINNGQGSCFSVENFKNLYLIDCLLMSSFAFYEIPGFFFKSDVSLVSKAEIRNSLFYNNTYIPTGDSKGCAIFFDSINEILINNTSFKYNTINSDKGHGGPAVFYEKSNLIIINLCFFEENESFEGSLILEGDGNVLSISDSIFLENHQISRSLSTITVFLVQGSLFQLSMRSIILISNMASSGLYYLNEIQKPLSIDMDDVSMFYNFGGSTIAISLGQETYNRTIYWKNSQISQNKAVGLATFIFIYIVRKIESLNITIENVKITDHENSYENGLIVSWADTIAEMFQIISFKKCIISNNSFDLAGPKNDVGAIINLSGLDLFKAFIEDTIFENNFCLNSWAVIYFVDLHMKNNVFINNSCVLTGLFYFDTSNVTSVNLTFLANHVDYEQLFTFNQFTKGNLTNITLAHNYASQSIFFSKKFNSFNLTNISIIQTNTILFFYFKLTNIFICSIFSQKNVGERFFYVENSNLSIVDFAIEEGNITFLLYCVKNSIIEFKQSVLSLYHEEFKKSNNFYFKKSKFSIYKLNFQSFGVISFSKMMFLDSYFLVSDSIFKDFKYATAAYFFSMSFATVFFNKTIFLNSNNILQSQRISLSVFNSTFSEFISSTSTPSDNLFYLEEPIEVKIFSSKFTDLFLPSNAFFISNSVSASPLQIINNSFINIGCLDCSGGAIHCSEIQIIISSNIFSLNHALYGGAINFNCPPNLLKNCNFTLLNNVFRNNSATRGGGAFKWQYVSPITINNSFINNLATYGNDFTSFFCRLGMKLIHNSQIVFNSFSSSQTNFFVLKNVISKIPLPYQLSFFPLDSYNQIILDKIATNVKITITDNSLLKNNSNYKKSIANFTIDDPQYFNNSVIPRIFGDLTLTQSDFHDFPCKLLGIISWPTSLIFLKFSADAIPNLKIPPYSVQNISSNEIYSKSQYFYILPLYLKTCDDGEVYDANTLTCTVCPLNMFVLKQNVSICSPCLKNAQCNGSNILTLNKNYWRSSSDSLNLYECNTYIENCVGGTSHYCKDGYSGILCQSCSNPNTKKNFLGKCQECLTLISDILKNIFFYLVVFCVIFFFCYIFIDNKIQENHRLLGKIFIMYLNYIVTNFSFPVEIINPQLKNYYNLLYDISKLDFWISFTCINFSSFDRMAEYLLRIFLVYFFVIVLFLIFRCKYKNPSCKAVFYIGFYFLSPMLFQFLISSFVCIQIEDEFYLFDETSIVCFTKEYFAWFFSVFLTNLLLIAVIFPCLINKQLNSSEIYSDKICNITIYCLGYKSNYRNYDIFRYFVNISLIFINQIFFIDVDTKMSIILIIMIYSLGIDFYFQIYESHLFFKLSTTLQIIFIATNYLILFSSNQENANKESYFTIMLPLIIMFHTYFIVLCGLLIFQQKIKRSFKISFSKTPSQHIDRKDKIVPIIKNCVESKKKNIKV